MWHRADLTLWLLLSGQSFAGLKRHRPLAAIIAAGAARYDAPRPRKIYWSFRPLRPVFKAPGLGRKQE
ncbi:MAG: hypothetical protein DU429_04640 [Candidatus Tokpelaia sp.]|nr:MAG: hypothetical protein DU430_00635 [Candidatus Tokpelaia sp.]KAA6206916.1 MAG: hypothetical protein DU429_04640 [Candidatus Tokpelaia sp.]